jgi:hypothetical protein
MYAQIYHSTWYLRPFRRRRADFYYEMVQSSVGELAFLNLKKRQEAVRKQ